MMSEEVIRLFCTFLLFESKGKLYCEGDRPTVLSSTLYTIIKQVKYIVK